MSQAGPLRVSGGGGSSSFTSIKVQTFTNSGTYTPTAGMLFCTIEVVGGGGGGGGAANSSNVNAAAGGGGGGYGRRTVSAATIGVSQTVTVGAGGTAGANTGGTGGTGGTSSIGVIVTATGGTGGAGTTASTNASTATGGIGGVGGNGDINANGGPGSNGIAMTVPATFNITMCGSGGNSIFGGGALGTAISSGVTGSNGNNGTLYGGGGSGAFTEISTPFIGGLGASGIVIITEYI